MKLVVYQKKRKVWQSYLENNTPAAGRIFWAYGPGRAEISILGMEPHPEEGAYGRIKLLEMPPLTEEEEPL